MKKTGWQQGLKPQLLELRKTQFKSWIGSPNKSQPEYLFAIC